MQANEPTGGESKKKKRILVIEDDAVFRYLLRMQLSLGGYELEEAEDGAKGRIAILDRPPDLILSDLNMPLLNGFELLSMLHSDQNTASIPVILLSGQSDSEAADRALKLGAADFLTKPLTREKLLESVRACLERTAPK